MSIFDIILLVIVGLFGLFGFWFGLVHAAGSLLGTIFGAYLASRYYEVMAGWLSGFTGWTGNFPKVLMFIVAFIVLSRLVGFVFWIINKVLGIFTKLPFIRSINHLLGLGLGLFEGILSIGLILYFIDRVPLSAPIMERMAGSTIAPIAISLAGVLLPFVPEALRVIKGTVDFVENIVRNQLK